MTCEGTFATSVAGIRDVGCAGAACGGAEVNGGPTAAEGAATDSVTAPEAAALVAAADGAGATDGGAGAGATDGGTALVMREGVSSGARRTSYRSRDMGSTARQPSSRSSIEKPLIGADSPRCARAAWSAFCQDSASVKTD